MLPDSLLDRLLARPAQPVACIDVGAWWPVHRQLARAWPAPIERSIAGGLAADRAGWAFAAGYQAALRALVPSLPDEAVAALCVTEEGGNTPKAIRSTIRDAGAGRIIVEGHKRWTTLGPASGVLLVAAIDAREDARASARLDAPAGASPGPRPTIRVVSVPTGAPGLALRPMPDTRFVPEVPHAQVDLAGVVLDEAALMPGDGYDGYVKPFRTVEDVHVSAAVLAYLFGCSRRRGWPSGWTERALAVLAGFADLAARDPRAPATHLLLAGTLALAHGLYAEASDHFAQGMRDDEAARWARDVALMQVAGGARTQRALRAWERLGAADAG
jgi:alkylation response protein AidB-like acyl-CoA dehydrogenase